MHLILIVSQGSIALDGSRRPFVSFLRHETKYGVTAYTSCTFTFFAPRSTIVMRKLRTWPARTGSAFASLAEGPFFHRDASMALNDDRSTAPADDCSSAATSRTS